LNNEDGREDNSYMGAGGVFGGDSWGESWAYWSGGQKGNAQDF